MEILPRTLLVREGEEEEIKNETRNDTKNLSNIRFRRNGNEEALRGGQGVRGGGCGGVWYKKIEIDRE